MALEINNFNFRTHSNTRSGDYADMALAPITLTQSAIKTAKAYFAQDEEGLIDGVGKVASSLDLMISGTSALFRSFIYLGMWLEHDVIPGLPGVFKAILLPYAIIGLVLSFFELTYEGFNLYRGLSLRLSLKLSDKIDDLYHNQQTLRNEFFEVSPQEKDRIEEYLQQKLPGPQNVKLRNDVYASLEKKILKNKFLNLGRRISPNAADEVAKIIRSNHPEDLRLLTQIVNVQTHKMLITHAIGLFSIILSAMCYAFLLLTFPHVMYVSLALALASIIFYIIYYVLEKGFVNQPGYQFSIQSCIPNWVNKIFNRDKEAPGEYRPLSSRGIQLMDMDVRQSPNYHCKTATCHP